MKNYFDLQRFSDESADIEATATDKDEASGSDDFTPKQQEKINQMIDRVYAKAYKKASDQARQKADEAKEAEKLKNLSESERTKQAMDEMRKELEALKNEKKESEMMTAARAELNERGYSFSDAIVSRLIGEDAEKTKESIDDFTKAFDKAVKEAVKKAVPATTPKAGSVSRKTKAEIMAIKNKAERQKAISENLDLFK